MAHAAVVSLIQILDDILLSYPCKHAIPDNKKQEIESLLENLSFLHDFLVDSDQNRIRDAQHLETNIRDAAYKAQDLIDSWISEYSLVDSAQNRTQDAHLETNIGDAAREERIQQDLRKFKFCEKLKVVSEEIDSIKQKVIGLHPRDANDRHQTHSLPPTEPSTLASGSDDTTVGYYVDFDDFKKIKERLCTQHLQLQVIPIIGMGGIGKTTLAKKLVHDKCVEERFSLRVWVTVSQNYWERDILLSLLKLMPEHSYENSHESDDKLLDRIHKCLKTHIYLIVMDDVWHIEVWDLVRNIFPDNSNGSRILLTTRLDKVAAYVNPDDSHHHKMNLLNETESWNLLCHKVFGRKSCPTELEGIGKKIARGCKGLPFTIVVISGLLSKCSTTQSEWEHVAKDVKLLLISNDTQ